MYAKKENPDDPTFDSPESPEFNTFKLMFKESPVFKGMPQEKLLLVSNITYKSQLA